MANLETCGLLCPIIGYMDMDICESWEPWNINATQADPLQADNLILKADFCVGWTPCELTALQAEFLKVYLPYKQTILIADSLLA